MDLTRYHVERGYVYRDGERWLPTDRVPMIARELNRWTLLRERAQELGREHGRNAASWHTPEDEASARAVAEGIDNGDPMILDQFPAPTAGHVFVDLEEDPDELDEELREELEELYVQSFSATVEHKLRWSARIQLGEL